MVRQGELKRLHVIQKVLERVIKQVEAAEILLLSSRQIGRIVKRINVCLGTFVQSVLDIDLDQK